MAALSASLGYADGDRIQRFTLIEFLGRIAWSVDVSMDKSSGPAGRTTPISSLMAKRRWRAV
jgi:hypothetical protein